jgi:hypothetical protein
MRMKVIQVKCPKCGNAISMTQRDRVFLCSNCNTLHSRDNGVETLNFEIAEFGPSFRGDGMYVPFWRLSANFIIRSERIEGGGASRLAAWLKGAQSRGGALYIFVPAAEFDPTTFKYFAMMFTENPPRYSTRFNFGGMKNMPVVTTRAEALELADFVVVTLEAEQPGILQQLDYTLQVSDAKLIYLPFLKTPNGLQPAL